MVDFRLPIAGRGLISRGMKSAVPLRVRTFALILAALCGAAQAQSVPPAGLYKGTLKIAQEARIDGKPLVVKSVERIAARVAADGTMVILTPLWNFQGRVWGKLKIEEGVCVLGDPGYGSDRFVVEVRPRGFSFEVLHQESVTVGIERIPVPERRTYTLTRVGD